MYFVPSDSTPHSSASNEAGRPKEHNAVSIASAIFRHLPLLLAIFFGTVLLTVVYTLVTPKQYESDMKILVQNERQVAVLNSTKGTVAQGLDSSAVDNQINSEIELLSNKDLMEHLVVFRSKLLPSEPAPQPGSKSMGLAIRAMAGRFDIEPVKKSNVITLAYDDISPELSQKVMRELEATYLENRQALNRPAGASKFFNTEVSSYTTRLQEAEARLSEFRQKNSFVDIEKEKGALDDNLHALEVVALSDEAQLRSSTSEIDELTRRRASLGKRIQTQITTTPNQVGVQNLVGTLTTLENQRIELMTKYKPTDRLVVELDQQIKNTEQAMTELRSRDAQQSSTDNNPTWLSLDQQLENLQVQRAGYAENLRIHKLQEANYEQRLNLLQQITPENDDLMRQVAELRGMTQSILDKRDSEQVDDLLDAAQFGNVAVAQQPTISSLHVKPRLSLNLLLGIVTGLFLCGITLIVLESTRSKILSASDLEALFAAPVLATVPEFSGFASAYPVNGNTYTPSKMTGTRAHA